MMMDYQALYQFAATWGLLLLVGLFLTAVVYALWPGNAAKFNAAARLPLADDDEEKLP